MTSEDTGKKAKLLELGEIFIPRNIDMPCFASLSRAGPDTGNSAHAFQFGDSRVKLTVSKDPEARLRLAKDDSGFSIYLDSEKFIPEVRILPLAAHAPNQAFINLSGECAMECAFCSMPLPASDPSDSMDPERLMKIISISSKYPSFEAVAITSGIPVSVRDTVENMIEMVKLVRSQYPKIPIGAEAYFEDPDDIEKFREAGATEMKINIETWPEERFAKICPNRDFRTTMKALEKAVEVFGRGRVTSNMIVGLGESDGEALEAVKKLADMGVVPNIRGIRTGPGNIGKLEKALKQKPERVGAERLLGLGKKHRSILEMNGLDTRKFDTMCFSCRCCDLVPMVDL